MSQKSQDASQNHDEVEAVVGKVREDGVIVTYPRYAVGKLTVNTDITCSIHDGWRGTVAPVHGQVVMLSFVQLFVKGWRAQSARPVTPHSQKS